MKIVKKIKEVIDFCDYFCILSLHLLKEPIEVNDFDVYILKVTLNFVKWSKKSDSPD